MGKKSRDKGARVERNVVNVLRQAGLDARRVPLSGAVGGEFSGDVLVDDLRAEVKARRTGSGWNVLDGWLGDNDALVLVKDRAEWRVFMPFERFVALLVERNPQSQRNPKGNHVGAESADRVSRWDDGGS